MALRLLSSAATTALRQSRKATLSTCAKTVAVSKLFTRLPRSLMSTSSSQYGALKQSDWAYDCPTTVDLENVTGVMKEELEAMYRDDSGDPFEQDPGEPIPYGTRDSPVLVPTNAHERMVACLCGEGDRDSPEAEPICIMLTFDEGMDKARCFDCGCWYQLVDGNPFEKVEAYDEVEAVSAHH